jgi:hypothetical protein
MKNVELHVGFQLRFRLMVQFVPEAAQNNLPRWSHHRPPRARRYATAGERVAAMRELAPPLPTRVLAPLLLLNGRRAAP